ncbi:MAG: Uncharacterized MFS-type transporter, partial [uncultured Nocardioides sp.]
DARPGGGPATHRPGAGRGPGDRRRRHHDRRGHRLAAGTRHLRLRHPGRARADHAGPRRRRRGVPPGPDHVAPRASRGPGDRPAGRRRGGIAGGAGRRGRVDGAAPRGGGPAGRHDRRQRRGPVRRHRPGARGDPGPGAVDRGVGHHRRRGAGAQPHRAGRHARRPAGHPAAHRSLPAGRRRHAAGRGRLRRLPAARSAARGPGRRRHRRAPAHRHLVGPRRRRRAPGPGTGRRDRRHRRGARGDDLGDDHDPAPHGARRRGAAGDRVRDLRPRARHVRVLAARRPRRRPPRPAGGAARGRRGAGRLPRALRALARGLVLADLRRAVPAGPGLVVRDGRRVDAGRRPGAARGAHRRAGRLRHDHAADRGGRRRRRRGGRGHVGLRRAQRLRGRAGVRGGRRGRGERAAGRPPRRRL